MNELEFVDRREPDWKRLSILCSLADATPTRLNAEELEEFVRLYRAVSADLSRVRTESSNLELGLFLNALVGKAYGILYQAPRKPFLRSLTEGLNEGARVIRRRAGFLFASLAVVLVAAGFAAAILEFRPEMRSYVVPEQMEELFDAWKSGKHEPRAGSDSLAALGMYSSNNPMVSIMAGTIAAGTFGLGTVLLLWQNGSLLGALSHDTASVGQLDHLLVSIAPHGATELTGMIVSGAAGLLLGWALISPGQRSRADSLRIAGKDALVLLVMAVAMMLIAAPFEAFLSFNPSVPKWIKAIVALLVFSGWLAYWTGAGKEAPTA